MAPQIMEIRPKAKRNATLLGVGCALFAIAGLWMMFSGEEIFAGFLAMIFGGVGLYFIPRLLRRQVSIALTPENIELRYPEGNAYIPWVDVDKVGAFSIFTNKMVGIRLKSYDRYLNQMSPALAEVSVKSLRYLKLMARAMPLLDVPNSTKVWSKLEGHDLDEGFKSMGKIGNLAEALLWTRNQFGFDIAFSWLEIDRPATAFADLLEQYHAATKQP